jgi:hypothetical protein
MSNTTVMSATEAGNRMAKALRIVDFLQTHGKGLAESRTVAAWGDAEWAMLEQYMRDVAGESPRPFSPRTRRMVVQVMGAMEAAAASAPADPFEGLL